jgi:hypothetical protein
MDLSELRQSSSSVNSHPMSDIHPSDILQIAVDRSNLSGSNIVESRLRKRRFERSDIQIQSNNNSSSSNEARTSGSAISAASNKKAKPTELTIQIPDRGNVASSVNLREYTPTSPNGPDTPTEAEHGKLVRSISVDFSDMFQRELKVPVAEVRVKQMVLRGRNLLVYDAKGNPKEARAITSGKGRSMVMTGQKVLGHTLYEKFLPKLERLTGLEPTRLAKALRDGLLDHKEFGNAVNSLKTESQKTALIQTVELFHNEIINRSSANLHAIVGALDRQIADLEDESKSMSDISDSKTMTDRLQASTLALPKGGQQLSRFHHNDTSESSIPEDLGELFRNNAKALARVVRKAGGTEGLLELSAQYIRNLRDNWNFESRIPTPKKKKGKR